MIVTKKITVVETNVFAGVSNEEGHTRGLKTESYYNYYWEN